jgi:hypothetical protein
MAVKQRTDGYINLLCLCENARELLTQYMEREDVHDFLEALASSTVTTVDQLVEFRPYEYKEMFVPAIWVHPSVAVHFTCLYDPSYFVASANVIAHLQNLPLGDLAGIKLETSEFKPAQASSDSSCTIV